MKLIPGRPKQYEPHEPADIVDRAIENQRHTYEQFRTEVKLTEASFVDAYTSIRDRGVDEFSPTEDLFHVVDIGEPSERETRRLFRTATNRVFPLTKSLGYIDAIRPAMRDALDRGVTVDVLMLATEHLSTGNEQRQREIRATLAADFPGVEVRISERLLPWRGTFIDPSLSYDSGQGLLLIKQEAIPNHRRQAAVTENPSFVAGLWQCFDLLWRHESCPDEVAGADRE